MTKEQVNIYTAGFFDGEGYIGFTRNRKGIEIRIVNTNKAIIDFLQENFNGLVYKRKKKKDTWDFIIVKQKDVGFFINSVYKHLIVKKKQVDIAIEKMWEERLGKKQKKQLDETIKRVIDEYGEALKMLSK